MRRAERWRRAGRARESSTKQLCKSTRPGSEGAAQEDTRVLAVSEIKKDLKTHRTEKNGLGNLLR